MEVFTKHVSMKKVSKDLQSNLVSTIYNQIMTSNLVSITQNKLEQQLTGISCTTIYLLSQSQSMLRLSCIQSPRHGLIGKELDQSSDHSSAKVARTLHSIECFSTSDGNLAWQDSQWLLVRRGALYTDMHPSFELGILRNSLFQSFFVHFPQDGLVVVEVTTCGNYIKHCFSCIHHPDFKVHAYIFWVKLWALLLQPHKNLGASKQCPGNLKCDI